MCKRTKVLSQVCIVHCGPSGPYIFFPFLSILLMKMGLVLSFLWLFIFWPWSYPKVLLRVHFSKLSSVSISEFSQGNEIG